MSARLVITDSDFNLFPLLTEKLKGKVNDLCHKNFVFCEEKLTLMAERFICRKFGGSFNTEVYSFGNYLRAKKPLGNVLTKEGSAMAIKRLLKTLPLKRFNRGGDNLAPSLFELISQLKSAKANCEDVFRAAERTEGILSAKLYDAAVVFSAYEQYLAENSLSDQSSVLSLLPSALSEDEDIARADVFIIGYKGFTEQIRQAISVLLRRAVSVTAILVGGENAFAFVNETPRAFSGLCAKAGIDCVTEKAFSDYSPCAKIIKDGLFNPLYRAESGDKPEVGFLSAGGVFSETERIAEAIKRKIISGGARYRDFTVIVPDGADYEDAITENFRRLDVPFFLDVKRKPENFPVVSLLYAYANVFIKGFTISALSDFIKNPYVSEDAAFSDAFENYILKYGISYGKFRKPFVIPTASGKAEELAAFDKFRGEIVECFAKFDANALLKKTDADKKTERFSATLRAQGETEDAEVLVQSFDKVREIISEIALIIPDGLNDPKEFLSVFSSGVSAMEISVIPQYTDAVFVGNFRQASLCKAEYLFAAGLTDAVPALREDVALLTDDDLNALADIKLLIEPKIDVVNRRTREEVALGLSAFNGELYLSRPLYGVSGERTVKSEILFFIEKHFRQKDFPRFDGYITEKQGMRTFAKTCSDFASLKTDDFSVASAFYAATCGAPDRIAEYANKEVKTALSSGTKGLINSVTSPTAIEDFYVCPYRAFLSRTLKIGEREEGKMNALSVGNLMHEILKEFMVRAKEPLSDEEAEKLFSEAATAVLNKTEYSVFDDGENAYALSSAVKECEKYCLKMSRWVKVSPFKAEKEDLEAGFGDFDGARYPAVPLLGGKVKLSGKIDRIDTCNDMFRIIDYKTGGKEVKDGQIYAGVKLQLYLYSLAVKDKKLAGAYYLRLNDEFRSETDKKEFAAEGKTALTENAASAAEEEFIPLNGKDRAIPESSMTALQKYVGIMAEKAAENMEKGVIIPSPYENACDYCEFAAMCRGGLHKRTPPSADVKYIEEAVLNEEKGL